MRLCPSNRRELNELVEFPNCWNVELENSQIFVNQEENDDDDDDDDEGEDEDEGDQEGGRPQQAQAPMEKNIKSSLSYQEFLQFLQLGCLGSPVQGYPTVVIILSTIPSSVSHPALLYICGGFFIRVFLVNRLWRHRERRLLLKISLCRCGQLLMVEL